MGAPHPDPTQKSNRLTSPAPGSELSPNPPLSWTRDSLSVPSNGPAPRAWGGGPGGTTLLAPTQPPKLSRGKCGAQASEQGQKGAALVAMEVIPDGLVGRLEPEGEGACLSCTPTLSPPHPPPPGRPLTP